MDVPSPQAQAKANLAQQSKELAHAHLDSLVTEKTYTDFTIVFSANQSFRVHRAILAARSNVFRELFTANPEAGAAQIDGKSE